MIASPIVSGGPAPRVAVIGGGITGLTAAHRLITAPDGRGVRPQSVTLVERSPLLGGKVITEHTEGFLIEGGPDSFVAGKGVVLDMAGELGLLDQVISGRPGAGGPYVWFRGRLHPIPEGFLLMAPSRLAPLLRSSLFSWRGKLRVLADLVIPRRVRGQDESLEQFVVRRLGREMLDRVAEPLVAGIHAADPPTMSLAATFPRFIDMERQHRSLILAARSAISEGATNQSAGNATTHFASFKEGMGQLPAAMIGTLRGVDIKTSTAVSQVRRGETGEGYRLTLDDGSEIGAAGLIMATPACDIASLLTELVPSTASVVTGIRQVATATVTVGYRREDIPRLTGTGFVVPSTEKSRIMGVSYLSRKWEGRVPDPRFELLRAFIGGPRGQELAMGGEGRLLNVVREELARMLGLTGRPVITRVHTWEGGLHQYTLGHCQRVAEVESGLARCPGLVVAGAGFYGNGLNECIQSGRRAADEVLAVLAGHGSMLSGRLLETGRSN